MKTLLHLTLAITIALPLFGDRRRVVAVSPAAQDDVKIVFVGVTGGGSDAMVDAGATSKVTKRVFGIRIEGSAATATLRAFLESHDGRSVIRIDGIALTTVPALIDAQIPVGKLTTHTIEIEVPASVAEGTFASAVRWEVATN
jgi:hypothetical protein